MITPTIVTTVDAERVHDTYQDRLGYLVQAADGHDYGRHHDRDSADVAAAVLHGTVSAWGQLDGSGGTDWHRITDHRDERDRVIEAAAAHEITVARSDFDGSEIDGWTLDGMDPAQWLDAMTME